MRVCLQVVLVRDAQSHAVVAFGLLVPAGDTLMWLYTGARRMEVRDGWRWRWWRWWFEACPMTCMQRRALAQACCCMLLCVSVVVICLGNPNDQGTSTVCALCMHASLRTATLRDQTLAPQ